MVTGFLGAGKTTLMNRYLPPAVSNPWTARPMIGAPVRLVVDHLCRPLRSDRWECWKDTPIPALDGLDTRTPGREGRESNQSLDPRSLRAVALLERASALPINATAPHCGLALCRRCLLLARSSVVSAAVRRGKNCAVTGRDRIKAALTHTGPDRAPRDLWALPYVSLFRKEELEEVLRAYPSDIGRPELSPGSGDTELARLARPGTYTDEWGSVWQLGEPGIVGEVNRPALADWSKLATYQPPWDLVRKRDLSLANCECEKSQCFMLSSVCARPFERLQFVRGTENVFLDLAYDTKEIRKLIEMIHEFYVADVTAWAESAVDGVFLMDDWGTNLALLINPDLWRSVFKPLYKDYCDVIHDAGKFVFFHSDGYIDAIYSDLIEIGVDAINSQLFCMDIERLAQKYKGRVTFWGEIDRQHALPFGSPQDVQAAVHRVRNALDDGTGGVIAQCEWGKDNSRNNIEAVFAAWLE